MLCIKTPTPMGKKMSKKFKSYTFFFYLCNTFEDFRRSVIPEFSNESTNLQGISGLKTCSFVVAQLHRKSAFVSRRDTQISAWPESHLLLAFIDLYVHLVTKLPLKIVWELQGCEVGEGGKNGPHQTHLDSKPF